MKTNEILPIENIRIGLQANNKKDLLKKMCELAAKSGKIENLEEVKKKVIERENLMTTGIGQGVALPHAKTNAVKGIVGAFAKLKENIDFNSIASLGLTSISLQDFPLNSSIPFNSKV